MTGFFLQAKLEDFDNDGFVDLVYSGGAHAYFKNNGDQTFSNVPNMFPYGDTMHSFATGDVNRDGQVDLYASYGNGYVSADNGNDDVLWINNGNPDQHWITFELGGLSIQPRCGWGDGGDHRLFWHAGAERSRRRELRHDVDVLLPLWIGRGRRGGDGDGVLAQRPDHGLDDACHGPVPHGAGGALHRATGNHRIVHGIVSGRIRHLDGPCWDLIPTNGAVAPLRATCSRFLRPGCTP